MDILPVTLQGRTVRLEPLTLGHVRALWIAAEPGDIFEWFGTPIRSEDVMRDWVAAAIKMRDAGTGLPFCTIAESSGAPIGSSRYGNIDRANRRLEIGWTWLAADWQKTAANTEAKLLMLGHAFDNLGCVRVEFKTDSLNQASLAGLRRLGAVEEGTFRKHMLCADGRWRDSVYFSITDEEWTASRGRLQDRLARHASRG